MTMTDPIADMLTRIRNGLANRSAFVEMPSSKIKVSIAEIMVEEGYLDYVKVIKKEGKVQDTLVIGLKYVNKEKAIRGLKRISKPSLRVYAKATSLPKVLGGMGIAIISTSNGVMTDKNARKVGAGGEVLAYVW
ncbi:MAG: 30S ribosomal protein S8 [Clostridiales bacterium]|jgi:small subunit ribosomal protein S8|nr:30S ribosomal protein S8 [Clostridiales bacterium]